MQRGDRFVLHRSSPMQRGAQFLILHVPFRALCWAQAVRPKCCKINAFLLVLNVKGAMGAATRRIPKSKNCKIDKENQCFSRMPWGALWHPLRVCHFCVSPSWTSTWPPLISRNICKRNAFWSISSIKGTPEAAIKWIPKSNTMQNQ